MSDEDIRKLRELGELHESGVLTETEFEQGKARLLGTDATVESGDNLAVATKPAVAPSSAIPATSPIESEPGTDSASTSLSPVVIVALVLLTAGIGVPIYLWLKDRRRAAIIVAVGVAILLIVAGLSDDSSSSSSNTSKDASSSSSQASSTDKSAETDSNEAADEEAAAAEEAAAEAAAKKDAAAKAAAAKKRREAAAARRRARIASTGFPDQRTLKLVLKNPDAHTGEWYRVWGEIMQFDSRTGTDTFLANIANRNTTSYGFFDGETALISGSERQLARFIDDDLFTAVVEVVGSYSYDTAIGGSNTVAQFQIVGELERQGSNAG
ncbi:MAG: SHOCT domain-containing protein [Thermoleophilia bacterium]|nr:SHOCT domain-containing protein [Thermoleophilia bacterium]